MVATRRKSAAKEVQKEQPQFQQESKTRMAQEQTKQVFTDLPYSVTPDSLSSFPVSNVEIQAEQSLDRRKRVHLECEHRRRRQIAEGLDRMRGMVLEGFPNESKMEVLISGIKTIEFYEKTLQELSLDHLELTSYEQ